MTGALPRPRVDSTFWTGIWIAEDVRRLPPGFESGNWIDIVGGDFSTTMDALGYRWSGGHRSG